MTRFDFNNEDARGVIEVQRNGFGVTIIVNGRGLCDIDIFPDRKDGMFPVINVWYETDGVIRIGKDGETIKAYVDDDLVAVVRDWVEDR